MKAKKIEENKYNIEILKQEINNIDDPFYGISENSLIRNKFRQVSIFHEELTQEEVIELMAFIIHFRQRKENYKK